ncbi:MAG TPA: aspartyl/asparaginyl beta-hydroxylase domain-containing protein [Woeseiaceae bacterium]|nr:aspartyl/asparaginyl beta-hydroxylase domain-containing protein [Woeseiaceae bacterium]
MNFAGNFRHLGGVDIAALRQQVLALDEQQWSSYSLRQKRYEVHRDTETIGLVFDPDFRHSHPTRLPALDIFHDELYPALTMVAGHYENTAQGRELAQKFGLGYFIRATLVRLRPGGTIDAHQDNNFSLTHSHRVHLPVLTNEQVLFTVGRETLAMPAGELYEINNRRMHSVHNGSSEHRVHFILDFVLRGEKCCCGELLHPDTMCSPQACMATDRQQVPCHCHPE